MEEKKKWEKKWRKQLSVWKNTQLDKFDKGNIKKYKDKKLFTAFLDNKIEKKIQKALDELAVKSKKSVPAKPILAKPVSRERSLVNLQRLLAVDDLDGALRFLHAKSIGTLQEKDLMNSMIEMVGISGMKLFDRNPMLVLTSLTSSQIPIFAQLSIFYEIKKYFGKRYQVPVYLPSVDIDIQRSQFTSKFAWAIPSKDAIIKIKNFIGLDLALELGSGTGLWAKLLQIVGVNIIATDPFGGHFGYDASKTWTKIEKLNCFEALKKYKNANTLVMIWPPGSDSGNFESLMTETALEYFTGNKIVFIGIMEQKHGLSDEMLAEARKINILKSMLKTYHGNTTPKSMKILKTKWKQVDEIQLPNWPNIEDMCYLFERQTT